MTINTLMLATQAARQRTKDNGIGVLVKVGQYQVVRVTYPTKRTSKVEPLSVWVSLSDAIAYLEGMQYCLS